MEAYLDGEEPDVDDAAPADPQGHAGDEVRAGDLRLGLQEQGRAADAERRRSTSCRRPLDVPAYMGFKPGDETETRDIARSADDGQPFSGLAFKIMNDPFVGSLTFTRIYSGYDQEGRPADELHQGEARAGRAHDDDARDQPRGDRRGLRRRHHRAGGPEGHHDRRHALRSAEAGGARDDDLPRAGDRDRHRAEDQERPGEDEPGPAAACRRGSVASGSRPTSRAARRS